MNDTEKISGFSLFLIYAIVIFDQNILVVNSKMKYFDENEQKSIIQFCKWTVSMIQHSCMRLRNDNGNCTAFPSWSKNCRTSTFNRHHVLDHRFPLPVDGTNKFFFHSFFLRKIDVCIWKETFPGELEWLINMALIKQKIHETNELGTSKFFLLDWNEFLGSSFFLA